MDVRINAVIATMLTTPALARQGAVIKFNRLINRGEKRNSKMT